MKTLWQVAFRHDNGKKFVGATLYWRKDQAEKAAKASAVEDAYVVPFEYDDEMGTT